MYLMRDAVKSTLTTLRQIGGATSSVAMDFWYYIDRPDVLSTVYRISANLLHILGEPVTFSIHPEDAPAFLDRLGFRVLDVADSETLARRYVRDGRRIPPGVYLVHAAPASRSGSRSASVPGDQKRRRR
jgi:O-methyltransferase involved in polyketide biosynthesis